MTQRTKGYLALSTTSFVWGTTWVASKIGIHDMPALQMAYIRQFIAGLGFVVYFLLVKKIHIPTRKQFAWLFMLAILMFVFANGLSTWSLAYIPTGLGALIGALYPLSVVIIERMFFKSQKMTALTFLGLFLGIGGVGIVFYENAFAHNGPSFFFGIILALIAMLSWSLGTIFIARNRANINPYYGTGWQMLISSFILFIWAEAGGQTIPFQAITWQAWSAIIYLVIFGSIISFIAFIYSMNRLPAAIASLYAYLNPLVAMVIAAILLHEQLTIHIVWGALVTLAGVFMVNYSIKKKKAEIIAEPEQ